MTRTITKLTIEGAAIKMDSINHRRVCFLDAVYSDKSTSNIFSGTYFECTEYKNRVTISPCGRFWGVNETA